MAKIALCGASGSGKSTLARWMSEKYKILYMENSAGLILPEDVKERLVRMYGWTQSGHADVIRLGNINPGFAIDFQTELLKVRTAFIKDREEFIFDRSPVDNLAYFLLQCGHIADEVITKRHLVKCIEAMEPITHLIYLPTPSNGVVENNGSRVANWYYQRMVTAVFKQVIRDYFLPNQNLDFKYIEVGVWDWQTRCRTIDAFMES